MTSSWSAWLVIVFALGLANLPFVSEQLFCCYSLSGGKTLAIRCLELVVGYGAAGLLGMGLEIREGQSSPQGWEFYVITWCLFLTLAFPGFVYRYLSRRGVVD